MQKTKAEYWGTLSEQINGSFYKSFKNYRQFIGRFKGKTWILREKNVVIGETALKKSAFMQVKGTCGSNSIRGKLIMFL